MSIIDKIAVAATATSFAIRRDQARAALRAIKPEDVSAAQLEAFTRIMPAHYFPKSKYADDLRRAIAAAIAAGAEQ